MCVFQCRSQFADWVVDDHVCLIGVVDSDRWLHFDRSVSQSRSHDFRRFSRQRPRLFFFFCRLRTLILFEPATNARRFGRSRTNDLLVVRSSLSERPVSCKSLLLLDSFLSTIYEIGASIFSADNSKISRPNRVTRSSSFFQSSSFSRCWTSSCDSRDIPISTGAVTPTCAKVWSGYNLHAKLHICVDYSELNLAVTCLRSLTCMPVHIFQYRLVDTEQCVW